VLQLLNYFPQAATEINKCCRYPLHIACEWTKSENVILALIDANLLAVKVHDKYGRTALQYARNQSETIINVLDTLMKMSDHDLKKRIDIPMTVLRNGFYNIRCHNSYQWLLRSKPTKHIQVSFFQEQQILPPAYKKQCTEKYKK
jgi:Ankyrin repeat